MAQIAKKSTLSLERGVSSLGGPRVEQSVLRASQVRLSEHIGLFANFVTFFSVEDNRGSIVGQNFTRGAKMSPDPSVRPSCISR